MNAVQFALRAAEILAERREIHGNPIENHENIATMWNAWLEITGRHLKRPITAYDVAKMMGLLKTARGVTGEYNRDDELDQIGYGCCAAEIAERRGASDGS